ncbi:unnamed protein product [Thlaspi arvense]|uniref:Uncharacterized protein n=1 Tax=Thlaspi arvense TaxID=13288 RepID=A0AAU9RKE9_THLAR|nr:unnamed protein product [Thlaspi arvense]
MPIFALVTPSPCNAPTKGCGGRFLNTKISGGGKGETEDPTAKGQPIQPTESQNSEVLQSDSGNLKSPKE